MSSMKLRLVSAASTNLTPIKQQGANLRGVIAINTNAAARFLKFYDAADAVNVGTTVPALTLQLPASSQTTIFPSDGISFKNTMSLATTVLVADSDTSAVGAGDIVVTVLFE